MNFYNYVCLGLAAVSVLIVVLFERDHETMCEARNMQLKPFFEKNR